MNFQTTLAIHFLNQSFHNKIKSVYRMTTPQNFSLLKAQVSSAQQTYTNPSDLKAEIKKKDAIIAEYSRKVEQKRQEMKKMSKEVNSLIEKQMKKPTKERPTFHVTYSSQKLNALKDSKDKIFAEIEKVKQQIRTAKQDCPQSIVSEVNSNEAKMAQIQIEIVKAGDVKSIITRTLEQNKLKLDKIKATAWQADLEKRQAELVTIKKQCKQLEKEINMFTAEQLQISAFFFEIKDRFEKQVIEENIQQEINQQELEDLLEQIRQIYEKRKIIETQGHLKTKNQQKMIVELEKSIAEKNIKIREIQNDLLRAGMTTKRMNSMVNLRGQYSNKTSGNSNHELKVKKSCNPQQKKIQKRMVSKVYMIQKDDANCIYIGEWSNDAKPINTDKQEISINSIDHVKSLTFFINKGRVVGLKSIYIDKNNTLISGKDLTVDVPTEAKVEIHLQDVSQLEYSRKSQEFYLRFIYGNGSWKELGQRGSQVQKINLESYYVKLVEALTNDAGTFISSLKFVLQDKIPQRLGLSDVAERTSSQMSYSNLQSPLKRKVVLRGRSLKKIKQQAIIDHRLMLNKLK